MKRLAQVLGVLGGRLHRHHAHELLADHGIVERLEELGLDRQRQEVGEERLAGRAELVVGVRPGLAGLARRRLRLQRQQLQDLRHLAGVALEAHVGDPDRGIEPMAPDLKTVEDLKKPEIIELFADPEGPGKGRIITCVPGWECEIINADQLKAYGLDEYYNLVNPGSGDAMHAALYGAYQKGEPYITYEWGPEWVTGKLDLTVLEEPPYDEAVWNENHGCAYAAQDLFITAHKTFPEKAPELVEMFGKWKLDTKTLGQALAYMEDTGGEPFDAALDFIQNREDIWTTFVPEDVAKKVKEAVTQGIVEPQGTEQ